MNAPYVIVWDLDGTLGRFDALNHKGQSAEPVSVRVRPHLREALEALSALGFRHTLLTLATPFYAELVLHGLGVRELFERVEGLGQRGKGDAAGIGEAMGIAEAERPHSMLFIGDHPMNDEPRDERVVFHLEMFGLDRSARDVVGLVSTIRDMGGGSIRQGFDALGRQRTWRERWAFWRGAMPMDRPVTRTLPGLEALLMMRRQEACPVIAFAAPPEVKGFEETALVPAELLERIAERVRAQVKNKLLP